MYPRILHIVPDVYQEDLQFFGGPSETACEQSQAQTLKSSGHVFKSPHS
jgi:hypothetical protein